MMIHIYYRQVPSVRCNRDLRPEWFSHELCFANLLQTLLPIAEKETVKLNVIFDGSEEDLDGHFTRWYLENEVLAKTALVRNARLHRIAGGTQFIAWEKCLTIAKHDMEECGDNDDLIYLLENDYMHVPEWYGYVQGFAAGYDQWDYISLYDHRGEYPEACSHQDAKQHKPLKSNVIVAGNRHWRTTSSTCASFLMQAKTFKRDYGIFINGFRDYKTFRFLTRFRRRRLLTPVPGLSTHCMDQLMAPSIDWECIVSQTKAFVRHIGVKSEIAEAIPLPTASGFNRPPKA